MHTHTDVHTIMKSGAPGLKMSIASYIAKSLAIKYEVASYLGNAIPVCTQQKQANS